jgi:hypothetical protein
MRRILFSSSFAENDFELWSKKRKKKLTIWFEAIYLLIFEEFFIFDL